jgi:ribosome-binding ATPase YchF (GTP1/OBG family)
MLLERLTGLAIKRDQIILAMKKSKLDFEKILDWKEEDTFKFATTLREVSKPILIVANKIDRKSGEALYLKLKKEYNEHIYPCSGLAEFWLRKYEQQGIIEYIPGNNDFKILKPEALSPEAKAGLESVRTKILQKFGSTGIQDVLNYMVFNVLNQIVVYPVFDAVKLSDKDGNILPDAHLVKKGTGLKEFVAEKIHTDLAKNFLYGINARTKMRLGESYELENNDIVKIISAAK